MNPEVPLFLYLVAGLSLSAIPFVFKTSFYFVYASEQGSEHARRMQKPKDSLQELTLVLLHVGSGGLGQMLLPTESSCQLLVF